MAKCALYTMTLFCIGTALDLFARNLTEEPPRTTKDARTDLGLDLSGRWRLTTATVINEQWIFQECLEVTITGNASLPNGSALPGGKATSPMHHHIADGRYITFDDTETSATEAEGYFSYKAIIAAPTKAEAADGATAVLVFYEDDTMPAIDQPFGITPNKTHYTHGAEVAIRYIDSQGRLTLQQNSSLIAGAAPLLKFEKFQDVSCSNPWTSPSSDYCTARKQAKPDMWDAFTPACCGEYGGSSAVHQSIANPKWVTYNADCSTEAAANNFSGSSSLATDLFVGFSIFSLYSLM